MVLQGFISIVSLSPLLSNLHRRILRSAIIACALQKCALNGRCGMKCPCVSADRRLALKIPAWWVMDDGHLNNKAGRLVDYAYLVHINIRHMLAAKFTRKSSIVWKLRMWMAPHGNSKVCANNKIQDRFFWVYFSLQESLMMQFVAVSFPSNQ